jgi:hypothetical protein
MPVFTKQGDEYLPLQGDFVEESINDNEVITLDSQRMYDMEEGTPLRTVINLNEVFNAKLVKDYRDGKITYDELVNNIKIYVSPEGSVNKPVGFLRAITKESTKDSETFSRLHLIRRQAANAALNSKTPRVEVGITIPFKQALLGSPNMNVKMEDGQLVAAGMPITQEALDMVDDYGYVLNGRIFTKNGTNLEKGSGITIFATSVSNRVANRDKKIPIVVFKFKGMNVAFPVSLRDRGGNKGTQVLSILNNPNDSDLAKVVKLNELLIRNNIDPKVFNITSLDSPQVQQMFEMFNRTDENSESQIKDVADVEEWLDPEHNKTTLLNSIEIAIDITDTPFNAPKGILDLQGMRVPTEDDLRIEAVNNLDGLAKRVNNEFDNNNPFAEMTDNWEFYDKFEEVGVDRFASSYIMKLKNANILINSFGRGVRIPKTVREVLGDDLIAEIKEEIRKYDLIQKGPKPDTSFVNQEGSETVQEQENKCNG